MPICLRRADLVAAFRQSTSGSYSQRRRRVSGTAFLYLRRCRASVADSRVTCADVPAEHCKP
jgi:hypothetical protein